MSVSRVYRKRGTWHICSGGRGAVQFVMLRVIRFAAELKVFASYFPQYPIYCDEVNVFGCFFFFYLVIGL